MSKVLLKVNNKVISNDGKLIIGEKQEGTLLKTLLDNTKNARNLLQNYTGDNLSDLIQYNDTENVELWERTFNGCSNATQMNRVNTNKAKDMQYCFCNMSLIPKIDLSKYHIPYTSYSQYMFYGNYSLKAVIIRSFGDTYVLNSNSFGNCYWLLGQTHATYNPNGEQGYVYVPRDMISILQNETNWSTMQFRALEDYTKDGTTTGEFDDEKAGI